jgi:hypothetical protein
MDLQMPVMDGFTATETIREDPRFASLPIIAMTAHATLEERDNCIAAGMNEHIGKPIDVACLYDTLRRWLKPAEKRLSPSPRPLDDSPLPDDLPGLDADAVLASLLEKLSALNALLADDDASSCGLFAEIETQLAAVDKGATSTAGKALAVFDFSEAMDALRPMENGLRTLLERPAADPA